MVTVFINYHTDLFMKYLRYSFNLFVCLFINGTSLSEVFKGTVHQLDLDEETFCSRCCTVQLISNLTPL